MLHRQFGRAVDTLITPDTITTVQKDTLFYNDCSSTSGWAVYSTASLSIVSGQLNVASSTSGFGWGTANYFTTQAGVTYTVSFYLDMGTCSGSSIRSEIIDNTFSSSTYGSYTTSGHKSYTFTATGSGFGGIAFVMNYPGAACGFSIDSVLITYDTTVTNVVNDTTFRQDDYRYGFNKQEKDDEVSVKGGSYTAEFWEYDSRLGRRWNLDPKPITGISDYACFANSPIVNKDPDGDVVVAAVVGFFKGLFAKKENFIKQGGTRIGNAFRRSGRDAANAAKIWGGLFASDKNKSFMGRVGEVLSRFTYQLPQTLLGLGYNQMANIFGNVTGVEYFHGATAVEGAGIGGNAVTLGSFISLGHGDDEANVGVGAGSYTLMHEYGHYLQSQKLGWGYLLKIGLPSIRGAEWTEWDANQRSADYLEKHYSNFKWDPNYYDTKPVPSWVAKGREQDYKDYIRRYSHLPGYTIDNPDIWHVLNIPKPRIKLCKG